ncbi:MAG: hypothetical protein JSS76_17865 [Bacteroidetes bacterium]|nr:hypothetical protein [Bacteroidota bacterium]
MTVSTIKENYVSFLQNEYGYSLKLPHYPWVLLEAAIEETLNSKINDVPFYKHLSEANLYCYINSNWKNRYEQLLNLYSETSPTSITIGGVSPQNIYDHKAQFESLFNDLDELELFKSGSLF